MRYEWDEAKRSSNARKHGIDFADCHVVFDGEGAVTIEDPREHAEQRFITFGWLRDHLVVVAHTERHDAVRIISARKASTHEYRLYIQLVGKVRH